MNEESAPLAATVSHEDIAYQRLAPRARMLFYLQSILRLLLFWTPATAGLVAGLSFVMPFVAATVVSLAFWFFLALLALWFPTWSFDRWGYVLRERDLVITHGVVVRQVSAIPSHRIQHVDTHQGPLEQLMGLARIHIYTASGSGADGVIPGLDLEVAEALRDQLVGQGGDDGV